MVRLGQRAFGLAVGLLALLAVNVPAPANSNDDETSADWRSATSQTQVPASTGPDASIEQVGGGSSGSSDDQVTLSLACLAGIGSSVLCSPLPCVGEGQTGDTYVVYVNGNATDETWCATEPIETEDAPPQVTPGMVAQAFQSYSWPASELVVQPPNGRTAVNFDTFFFTEDTAPVTHVFRLLGRRVEVEATPSSFTWVWGDGAEVTTSSPGGPYPGGDVVHRYAAEGGVSPRLDTTYTGRYRVGGGPWVGIPGSLTVAGETQALDVVEVQPTLVAP